MLVAEPAPPPPVALATDRPPVPGRDWLWGSSGDDIAIPVATARATGRANATPPAAAAPLAALAPPTPRSNEPPVVPDGRAAEAEGSLARPAPTGTAAPVTELCPLRGPDEPVDAAPAKAARPSDPPLGGRWPAACACACCLNRKRALTLRGVPPAGPAASPPAPLIALLGPLPPPLLLRDSRPALESLGVGASAIAGASTGEAPSATVLWLSVPVVKAPEPPPPAAAAMTRRKLVCGWRLDSGPGVGENSDGADPEGVCGTTPTPPHAGPPRTLPCAAAAAAGLAPDGGTGAIAELPAPAPSPAAAATDPPLEGGPSPAGPCTCPLPRATTACGCNTFAPLDPSPPAEAAPAPPTPTTASEGAASGAGGPLGDSMLGCM